jgi:hypothetical protein
MNKLPFFKFDAESWLTGKIQVLPVDQIGIFINLAARIWKAGGSLKNDRFLPRLLGATPEQFSDALTDFLELEIVTETDGFLRIKFLDDQLAARSAFISKCAEGGRKGKKKTTEVPASNLEGTLSDLEGTQEVRASNKKEDIREKKEDIREGSIPAPAPAQMADAETVLGPELAGSFRRWLVVWRETHGGGRDMPVYRQEAQLRLLHGLPEDIRKEAIERAILGGWRAIHDIREPRWGEKQNAGRTRETGTLTEAPKFNNNNERGKK